MWSWAWTVQMGTGFFFTPKGPELGNGDVGFCFSYDLIPNIAADSAHLSALDGRKTVAERSYTYSPLVYFF